MALTIHLVQFTTELLSQWDCLSSRTRLPPTTGHRGPQKTVRRPRCHLASVACSMGRDPVPLAGMLFLESSQKPAMGTCFPGLSFLLTG